MLNYHPDKPAYSEAAHDNFLTDPQWLKGVGLLEKFGLSLELHVLPRQMLRSVLRHAPPSAVPRPCQRGMGTRYALPMGPMLRHIV